MRIFGKTDRHAAVCVPDEGTQRLSFCAPGPEPWGKDFHNKEACDMKNNPALRGALLTLLGGMLWGFSGTCGQFLLQTKGLTSEFIVPIRLTAAGLALLLVCAVREGRRIFDVFKKDARDIVIFGVLGMSMCQYTYFSAIGASNAGTATVLQYTGPVLILVFMSLRSRRLPRPAEVLAIALALTFIGKSTGSEALKIIDLSAFDNMKVFEVPDFTFLGMFKEGSSKISGIGDVFNIFMLFAPVAFVVLAEHIADHKNLGSVINRDLITDPGLDKTLLGDGLGSVVGAFFGGCPNTTYGESVGCVAITGNASISTIFITAIYCIILSFFQPFVAFVNSIPSCIVGGVCIALYGFIAVSGLKMLQPVDLNDNRNLFVVAAILVCGIGGLELRLGSVTISAIATALIVGILVNVLFNRRAAKEKAE